MIGSGLFRIGRDAEVRRTNTGDSVASLSLAFDYGKRDESGNRPTQWVDAALWGKRAEALAPHLTKGKQVFATLEEPHIESYAKSDGTTGVKLTARVGTIEFAGRRETTETAPARAMRVEDMNDDIPF